MTKKKIILVLGASGLLGGQLTSGQYLKKYKIFSQSLKSKTDLNFDITEYNQVIQMIKYTNPDFIINLVGLTNVDVCEKLPDLAFKLNVKTVENIVEAIKNTPNKPYLIHISTDQVYDGVDLSLENNINIKNHYAFSKYSGELIACKTKCTIFRTNFFGKSRVSSRNSLTDWLFKELILDNQINVFENVYFNPLSMHSLCKIIELAIEKKYEGVFNLGSNNGINKADFALIFARYLNFPIIKINKIKIEDASFLFAYRPKNMMMKLSKFENKFNIRLPNLIEEIRLVTEEYQP